MHSYPNQLDFEMFEGNSDDHFELEQELEQGLSGTTLESMFGGALRRPLLSYDEQCELIRRAQAGDEEAQAQLIESNLRLVISVARRYARPGLPIEDLVQEGAIGLIKAIQHFDLNRGLRFSTYAIHWIRQSVTRAADAHTNLIRLPNHAIDSLRKISRTRGELSLQLGREPTHEEIAQELGMPVSKVDSLLRYSHANYSLDQKPNEGCSSPLLGLLSNQEESDPETVAIERVWISQIFDIIDEELTPGERWAVYRLLGMDVSDCPPHTNKPLSRERARQLERQALNKLRTVVRERLLADK